MCCPSAQGGYAGSGWAGEQAEEGDGGLAGGSDGNSLMVLWDPSKDDFMKYRQDAMVPL